MTNLETKMKAVAAKLTGKEMEMIPDKLEDICGFIADNYQAFQQVAALEAVQAAPTQVDFNNLIEKLKEAKIFI